MTVSCRCTRRASAANFNTGTLIETLTTTVALPTDSLNNVPLGPGTYNISQGGMQGSLSTGFYGFTLNVAAIPEPTGVVAALLGMAALARRPRT